MNERKDIKTQNPQDVKSRAGQEGFLRPAVDIYENAAGITLKADLPGVSRDRLAIRVDKDNLLIEGQVSVDMPEGMEALHADVRATRFRRSFTLSHELDTEQISAQMKDGVLTLQLPKRAELKPRRIEVGVG